MTTFKFQNICKAASDWIFGRWNTTHLLAALHDKGLGAEGVGLHRPSLESCGNVLRETLCVKLAHSDFATIW